MAIKIVNIWYRIDKYKRRALVDFAEHLEHNELGDMVSLYLSLSDISRDILYAMAKRLKEIDG